MKRILVVLLSLSVLQLNAQDLPHFKRVVKELSSAFPHYHTPADNVKTVKWDSYEPVFKLITGFIANEL